MYIDNSVVKNFGGQYSYDRFALASTLIDVSFKGANCSLIDSQAINGCESCKFNYMCSRIEDILVDYTEKTTVVTDSFDFNS